MNLNSYDIHYNRFCQMGKLLFIGGLTDETTNRDVWEMDTGQVTTYTAKGSSSNQILLQHIDRQILYHSVEVSSSNRRILVVNYV